MWAKTKRWFYKLIGRKSKEDEVFGLEVFSANGETVFEAGKSYVKIVGEWTIPESDYRSDDPLPSTFVLPSIIPTSESPVIICSKLFPPEYFIVDGRTVTVHHLSKLRFVSNRRYWTNRKAVLYLGYYG